VDADYIICFVFALPSLCAASIRMAAGSAKSDRAHKQTARTASERINATANGKHQQQCGSGAERMQIFALLKVASRQRCLFFRLPRGSLIKSECFCAKVRAQGERERERERVNHLSGAG
jgi:hypothetical protein